MGREEAWFEYFAARGRLRAMPLNWKGWSALLSLILAPLMTLGLAARWLLPRHHVGLFWGVWALTLVAVFCGGFWLVSTKDRRRRPPEPPNWARSNR